MPEPTNTHDPEDAAERGATVHGKPSQLRDQAPTFMLRGQAWLHKWLSNDSRLVFGLVIVVLTVVIVVVLSSSRFLRIILEGLDVLAFIGLFLVNWLGNGGVLVPIPGARFIGLLLIFQQAVLLPSWEVFVVAGVAMGLGLLSYYIAGARTAQSIDQGDDGGAEELAHQTGMLDEDAREFAPGADLDAQAVSAITGVEMPDAETTAPERDASGSRLGRLRKRFTTSLRETQQRAEPVLEQRGTAGMFLLCLAPTPMGTAAAYVGGLMNFAFSRYLLASFAAKLLLAGIIVALALVFSDTARAVQLPEIEIPILDITLFDDGVPSLPSPSPSGSPTT